MAKQKILLHSCCAPCSTAVIERLAEDFEITILYYNPNIYPETEYFKRKNEEIKYIEIWNQNNSESPIKMLDCDYESEEFYRLTKGFENEREGGARCAICFKLRLKKTATLAKQNGFDIFGTTLSVSPHKNSELLNSIGKALSVEIGVPYLEANFKKQNGYKRSVELAKENNLYRQNYCGCEFALRQQMKEAPDSLLKKY